MGTLARDRPSNGVCELFFPRDILALFCAMLRWAPDAAGDFFSIPGKPAKEPYQIGLQHLEALSNYVVNLE